MGPFLWIFGPSLFSDQSFVFRDAAHYYYPLYRFTAAEWSSGRVPLWNPLENAGQPLLADTTSAVLYPGKLLFALPLSYPAQYKLYIWSHLLLAMGTSFLLARCWGASLLAAGVCGLSYAFSGNVLFQYCNVVFLVGAAWLPLALLATDRMLVYRRLSCAVGLAAVLALMTIGGDPQTAYHAGLLAALYAAMLWRHERRRAPDVRSNGHDRVSESEATTAHQHASTPRQSVQRLHRLREHRFVLLAIAAIAGVMLAAVQILPATEWTRRSDRAAFESPRSLYEIPEYLSRRSDPKGSSVSTSASDQVNWFDGLLVNTKPGTHQAFSYDFSVDPWRIFEYIWPNVAGRTFPTNRRWLNVAPSETSVWTPSLYMGLLPLMLALSSMRFGTKDVRLRWLNVTLLLFLLGSLGWYGVGWLIDSIRHVFVDGEAGPLPIGDPFGGLYWLMSVLLPGYVYFRFPAKLLVVAALALSLLSARGWDDLFSSERSSLRKAMAWLGGISLIIALAVLAIRPFWPDWMSSVKPDPLFGPLDAVGAANELLWALLHTTLLCAAYWFLLGASGLCSSYIRGHLAILITALDLTLAQAWMVPYTSHDDLERESSVAVAIAENDARRNDDGPYRVYRASSHKWAPNRWLETSSSDRHRRGLRWYRDTLFQKFHLASDVSLVEAPGTMASHDYQVFLRVARQQGSLRSDDVREPHYMVLDALGTKYIISPDGFPRGTEEVKVDTDHVILSYSPHHQSRAWIVHHVQEIPPLGSNAPSALEQRTELVLFPEGHTRDLSQSAAVEGTGSLEPWQEQRKTTLPSAESCRVISVTPLRVKIEAELTRPGLVVLSDLFYPGWKVSVHTEGVSGSREAPIQRTNRVMRGVHLPAGKHRLVYRYRPASVFLGGVVSATSFSLLLIGVIMWRRKRCDR